MCFMKWAADDKGGDGSCVSRSLGLVVLLVGVEFIGSWGVIPILVLSL